MKHDPDTLHHAQLGLMALLPGIDHAIERLQAERESILARLAAMQNGDAPAKRGGGRPPGKGRGSTGWSADPEERKAEMQRRMAKWNPNFRQKKGFREKMRAAAKKRWAKMKPAERKQQLAKMQAGKRAALPAVRMQEAV